MKNYIKQKVSNLVPLSWKKGKNINLRVYNFYSGAQWWSNEQINEWQLKHLKDIITYAYYNVPGYNQLYKEAGMTPKDINSLYDIKYIPFTDKLLLRDNVEDFKSRSIRAKDIRKATTGGSTGIPLKFYIEGIDAKTTAAFMNTAWESTGWKYDDIGFSMRGSFIGDSEHISKKLNSRRFQISSFYLSDKTYPKYKALYLKKKPSFLHAFPSMAIELAKLVIKHGDIGKIIFKQIFLGSENFYDWQKDIIKTAFPDSTIMTWYGHSEGAIWAPWCEKVEKYHINPFYGLTEIIDEKDEEVTEGLEGEIVGTSFWRKATPFIRYRTLDYATKGAVCCPECGRNFQLLNQINGRAQDMIIGKTGRKFSLVAIEGNTHSKILADVDQFRYIQDKVGHVKLAIIPKDNSFTVSDKAKIESFMKEKLHEDFDLEVIIVEELPRTKTGKFSYLEQHLDIDKSIIS